MVRRKAGGLELGIVGPYVIDLLNNVVGLQLETVPRWDHLVMAHQLQRILGQAFP
jgi:hypothetical protein